MAIKSRDKKAHHVVPVTYLKRFADKSGKLFGYRKDDPSKPLHHPPESLGFINKYYSQPIPGGGWDHNALEDLFDQMVERHWPSIVGSIQKQEAFDIGKLKRLFEFIGALHVRVPAIRDAVELALAKMVMGNFHLMNSLGAFGVPPPSLEKKLNQIQATIDPHMSIHSMGALLHGFERIIDRMGFRVLRNKTDIPFLTSDNPVMFFDPSVSEKKLRPYFIQPLGPIEMFVPIDLWNVVHGHTDFKRSFSQYGLIYEHSLDGKFINYINGLTIRFAYQFLFADSRRNELLIERYFSHSPTFDDQSISEVTEDLIITRMIFGLRKKKAKWSKDLNN